MAEKITGTGFRPTEAPSARRADAKPANEAALRKSAAPAAGDTVELTRSARLMSQLEEAVASAPVVDAARVKSVKDALAAGTYVVDADAVAERMMQAEREIR
jgi:negative regulator of flagellin synthesis FlgM